MDALYGSVRSLIFEKELLPLLNAESVLLISNDKCQVGKLYIIGKERMCSDNDGSLAVS
jgi:hypothetical protein